MYYGEKMDIISRMYRPCMDRSLACYRVHAVLPLIAKDNYQQ